jgi:PKD repeat protein
MTVRVTPTGTDSWDAIFYVYRQDGAGMAGLSWITNGWSGASVVFDAQAGSTYYIQAGSYYGYGAGFALELTLIPAPPNDNFGDAAPISTLPYSDTVDLTGASVQSGEPTENCAGWFVKSIWYTFTPTTSRQYSVSSFGIQGGINVYTGASLDSLSRIACSGNGGIGSFHGVADTTYYVQSGTWSTTYGGSFETRLDVTPPPVVGFIWDPSYPSTFDTLTFTTQGWDPGGIGVESWAWDFGDGMTSTATNPQHRFARDGSYSVTLTGTTYDGRTNSDTEVVQVETHDVTIKWFSTTSRGRVGRTAPIQVGIGNTRYAETVQVDFYKGTPGGFQLIGTVTKAVPVMKSMKTTMFSLDYTFTNDDLAVGKVTFQAVATIQGNRPAIDAFPSDNTVTSSPTLVTR